MKNMNRMCPLSSRKRSLSLKIPHKCHFLCTTLLRCSSAAGWPFPYAHLESPLIGTWVIPVLLALHSFLCCTLIMRERRYLGGFCFVHLMLIPNCLQLASQSTCQDPSTGEPFAWAKLDLTLRSENRGLEILSGN